MSNNAIIKVGELRPSQLLFTFGVGATIDLPHLSVMVMGLDEWNITHSTEIIEPRLLRAVQEVLKSPVQKLYSPPIPNELAGKLETPFDPANLIGVPVRCFPTWMVCPRCRKLASIESGLFELISDPVKTDRNRWVHINCDKSSFPPEVVPARFLVACKKGHIDDFPWVEFVHRGRTDCKYSLKFQELGASGRGLDLRVDCETCGEKRLMSDAFGDPNDPNSKCRDVLGTCNGRNPHLSSEEDCKEPFFSILLGASNAWFPMMLSVLSVPASSNYLAHLVKFFWHSHFHNVEQKIVLPFVLNNPLLNAFSKFKEDEIWDEIQRQRTAGKKAPVKEDATDLKGPEWERLSNPDPKYNNDDFQLRKVPPPKGYNKYFSRIVLGEKLREVRALVGFTRVETPGDFSDTQNFSFENCAPLSRNQLTWVPAGEVRGEGIFLQFDEDYLSDWLEQKAVKARDFEFFKSHCKWREVRKMEPYDNGYPTIRFVLLHSFAHALMRQLSIECGYTSASIRERIYSSPPDASGKAMAGVLIYTATPDSEGTLGGLVSLGEPETLGRLIDQALESMRLCSSDPLCSEHNPSLNGQTIHGATCHSCLFAPETSCEKGNKYLDRSVLVETLQRGDIAFFK